MPIESQMGSALIELSQRNQRARMSTVTSTTDAATLADIDTFAARTSKLQPVHELALAPCVPLQLTPNGHM